MQAMKHIHDNPRAVFILDTIMRRFLSMKGQDSSGQVSSGHVSRTNKIRTGKVRIGRDRKGQIVTTPTQLKSWI